MMIALYGVIGGFFRVAWGGLLHKWEAHILAALLTAGMVCWCMLSNHPWGFGLIVGGASWVQWASPSRDFASSRSLAEAHLPWCCVSAVACLSWLPLLGVAGVVAAYYGFQRWWPDRECFWKPTVCAEAFGGLAVWVSAAAGLTL